MKSWKTRSRISGGTPGPVSDDADADAPRPVPRRRGLERQATARRHGVERRWPSSSCSAWLEVRRVAEHGRQVGWRARGVTLHADAVEPRRERRRAPTDERRGRSTGSSRGSNGRAKSRMPRTWASSLSTSSEHVLEVLAHRVRRARRSRGRAAPRDGCPPADCGCRARPRPTARRSRPGARPATSRSRASCRLLDGRGVGERDRGLVGERARARRGRRPRAGRPRPCGRRRARRRPCPARTSGTTSVASSVREERPQRVAVRAEPRRLARPRRATGAGAAPRRARKPG